MINAHDQVAKYYDALFRFQNYFDLELVEYLTKVFKERGAFRVLDCGCGAGNPSIGLSLNGFKVLGIDNSKNMLEVAKKNAREIGATLEFKEIKMEDILSLGEQFDCVICHDCLYHFETSDEMLAFFKTLKSILTDNGMVYIATKKWDYLQDKEARDRIQVHNAISDGNGQSLIVFDVVNDSNVLSVSVVTEEKGNIVGTETIPFPWYPFSDQQITGLLKKAGFANAMQENQQFEAKYNCIGIFATN